MLYWKYNIYVYLKGDLMELLKRKIIRLKYYDYSSNGAYFITICTQNKKHIFGFGGADSISAQVTFEINLQTF